MCWGDFLMYILQLLLPDKHVRLKNRPRIVNATCQPRIVAQKCLGSGITVTPLITVIKPGRDERGVSLTTPALCYQRALNQRIAEGSRRCEKVASTALLLRRHALDMFVKAWQAVSQNRIRACLKTERKWIFKQIPRCRWGFSFCFFFKGLDWLETCSNGFQRIHALVQSSDIWHLIYSCQTASQGL